MISLSLSNLTLILGSRTIFRDLYWEIQHDQRIGLIGPNGAGKSSLFKIITGEYMPEPGGAVVRAKGVTIGYLPQQPELDPHQTAFETALAGNPRVAELETELAQIETSFSDPQVYNNHQGAQPRPSSASSAAWTSMPPTAVKIIPSACAPCCAAWGFPEREHDKPIAALSGGQKKLVGLARLLLAQPCAAPAR